MAAGPDGALWLPDCDAIWRIGIDGGQVMFPAPFGLCVLQVTAGPDGAVWFTAATFRPTNAQGRAPGVIGRVTSAGTITTFSPRPDFLTPETITTGPDSALWFTEAGIDAAGQPANAVSRITPDGTVTQYVMPPQSCPWSITTGPDGALWFRLMCRGTIGRLTTSGSFSEFPA